MDRHALDRLATAGALELRGDGPAGSGLTLALQVVAAVILAEPTFHLQQWPFFTAARKGAPTRGFLRISRHPILKASPITHPHVAVLMDEEICAMTDCLRGLPRDGIVVCDSPDPPETLAQRLRLSGTVCTIDGRATAARYLQKAIVYIAMIAGLMDILPGCSTAAGRRQLTTALKKRRLPPDLIELNLRVYDASCGAARAADTDFAPADDAIRPWTGYGTLHPGAQSDLRLSRANRTAAYAPPGLRLRFADPQGDCNGCGLCIVNCPEDIIAFVPDERRGLRVTGADVTNYCKLCRECIAICPKKLFTETTV